MQLSVNLARLCGKIQYLPVPECLARCRYTGHLHSAQHTDARTDYKHVSTTGAGMSSSLTLRPAARIQSTKVIISSVEYIYRSYIEKNNLSINNRVPTSKQCQAMSWTYRHVSSCNFQWREIWCRSFIVSLHLHCIQITRALNSSISRRHVSSTQRASTSTRLKYCPSDPYWVNSQH